MREFFSLETHAKQASLGRDRAQMAAAMNMLEGQRDDAARLASNREAVRRCTCTHHSVYHRCSSALTQGANPFVQQIAELEDMLEVHRKDVRAVRDSEVLESAPAVIVAHDCRVVTQSVQTVKLDEAMTRVRTLESEKRALLAKEATLSRRYGMLQDSVGRLQAQVKQFRERAEHGSKYYEPRISKVWITPEWTPLAKPALTHAFS